MSVSYNKIIDFIREALTHPVGGRYSTGEDKEGRFVFADSERRIIVKLGVHVITVNKYGPGEPGACLETIDIPWEYLSTKQKEQIIELMDTSDNDDPEIDETLQRIFG